MVFLQVMLWMLLHSLWQGGILWLVSAVARRGRRPRTRSAVSALAVALFVGVQVLTAWWCAGLVLDEKRASRAVVGRVSESQAVRSVNERLHEHGRLTTEFPVRGDPSRGIVSVTTDWTPYLIGAWGLVSASFAVSLGVRLYRFRCRVASCPELPLPVRSRFNKLLTRMKLRTPVRFVSCDWVLVPAVTGWRRATVLMPPHLIEELPAPAVDAFVLHELAHVQQRDVAKSMILSVLRTAYFFNPFVHLLRRQVELDAELCSDQSAVAAADADALTYSEALINLADAPSVRFASGLADGPLTHRVKQLMRDRRALNRPASVVGVAVALVLAGGSMLAASREVDTRWSAEQRQRWAASYSTGEAYLRATGLQRDNPDALPALAEAIEAIRAGADATDPRIVRLIDVLSRGADANALVEFLSDNPELISLPSLEPTNDWAWGGFMERRKLGGLLADEARTRSDLESRHRAARAAVTLAAMNQYSFAAAQVRQYLTEPHILSALLLRVEDLERISSIYAVAHVRAKRFHEIKSLAGPESFSSRELTELLLVLQWEPRLQSDIRRVVANDDRATLAAIEEIARRDPEAGRRLRVVRWRLGSG